MCVLNIRLNWRGSVSWHSLCSPGFLLGFLRALGVLQLVGAEAALARLAVDERVDEAADVAARLPHPRMHEDRGIEALDVVARAHHRVPPALLQVALELDAERAVVPDRPEAAVDLRGLKHEPAPLGERHEFFHDVGEGHMGRETGAGPADPTAISPDAKETSTGRQRPFSAAAMSAPCPRPFSMNTPFAFFPAT